VVEILGAIWVNPVGYLSGPQAHSSGWDVGCNMGESSGIIKWPTQVVESLGAIWMNLIRYLSGLLNPFSDISCTTCTSQCRLKGWLYLCGMGCPRSITHGSPYHIYHLPIWVMHLNTFDMEHTIYVQDSFFNVNSTVMFVSWSDFLIWQLFRECLIWNVSYVFGTHFSIWIQQLCLCCDRTTLFGNFDQCHYWSE